MLTWRPQRSSLFQSVTPVVPGAGRSRRKLLLHAAGARRARSRCQRTPCGLRGRTRTVSGRSGGWPAKERVTR